MSNSGSDITGDGTETKPFASIQKAIDTLPKNLNGHRGAIHVAAGTYEGFSLRSFYGCAYSLYDGVEISGDKNGGTVITGSVKINSCEVSIQIRNLEVTGTVDDFDIYVYAGGGFISLISCKCTGTTAGSGILLYKAMAALYDCEVSGKTGTAIKIDGSVVFASYIKGSSNTVCFNVGSSSSGMAGLLIGDVYQITGTTKYLRNRGGVVFADGALV